MNNRKGLFALSPLFVFIAIYLLTSIIKADFYAIPISVAFMVSCIYAVCICKAKNLNARISAFSKGASSENIMLMIWIFVLAGAFANTAKTIGSVDATVNLMLSVLPNNMLLPGLFLATCFISLSIGTSVGTIVALVPIAAGLAQSLGVSTALMTAIVVGGAFFGDNLSFISDTTIAATSSQGCSMKDKFRVNFYITLPAAVIILAIYTFMGMDIHPGTTAYDVNIWKVIPYIAVLLTAIMGLNVSIVLVIGIIMTLAVGLGTGAAGLFPLLHAMGDGITSMGELIIVTMLAGGMFEVVRRNGGIEYIIEKISSRISGKRGAESVIALLVAIVDVCTANNTVAIISVGNIAKRISQKYSIDNRRAASILDTSSCCVQTIIPYGAQMLMASGLSQLAPMEIIPYLYYPMALIVCVALSIVVRYPKKYA